MADATGEGAPSAACASSAPRSPAFEIVAEWKRAEELKEGDNLIAVAAMLIGRMREECEQRCELLLSEEGLLPDVTSMLVGGMSVTPPYGAAMCHEDAAVSLSTLLARLAQKGAGELRPCAHACSESPCMPTPGQVSNSQEP